MTSGKPDYPTHAQLQQDCAYWLIDKLGGGCVVAQEYHNEDVFGIDKHGRLYRIEVKVSWSDFMAEWKKDKHDPNGMRFNVPGMDYHKAWYAAPNDLAARMALYFKERNSPNGVIQNYFGENFNTMRVIKKARVLSPISQDLFKSGLEMRADPNEYYVSVQSIIQGLAHRLMWDALTQRKKVLELKNGR